MILPVIICGGSGTRLWPMSRELYPKQLLPLVSGNSLLQDTLLRLQGWEDVADPILICNEEHRFLVAEQLRQLDWQAEGILLEPEGRGTAPAATVAALLARQQWGEQAELLVLPADHVILDQEEFRRAVSLGRPAARSGWLITFGVTPAHPETGYGYIRAGEQLPEGGYGIHSVASFVEKPDLDTARSYLASGDYLWNSGMFLFSSGRFLEEMDHLQPRILSSCRAALEESEKDFGFLRLGREAFASCPEESIDCAVMERTGDAAVVPLRAQWSDVGSWSSLWELGRGDEQGNVTYGDVYPRDSRGCYIRATDRLVATVGVSDLVVVETRDAVLVSDRNKSQEVKAVANSLKRAGREESRLHPTVHRPWGSYETIVEEPRFKVKRLRVKPGQVLSRQMHHHRAEHWVIVRGTARISNGERQMLLGEDQSTYIPLGTEHRLENPGRIDLELIEVQTGSYLGEDDILRLEDAYGR